jgi:hypothetical protein
MLAQQESADCKRRASASPFIQSSHPCILLRILSRFELIELGISVALRKVCFVQYGGLLLE